MHSSSQHAGAPQWMHSTRHNSVNSGNRLQTPRHRAAPVMAAAVTEWADGIDVILGDYPGSIPAFLITGAASGAERNFSNARAASGDRASLWSAAAKTVVSWMSGGSGPT